MKKIRKWQLCKAGTFGKDGATITQKDLTELSETFAPPRPISIGHEMARSDDFPKFGDVLSAEVSDDGSTLVGHVSLHPALEAAYDDALYNGWSVSIPRRASDGKRYLHSLAICGGVPPKIPALQELQKAYAYGDGDIVEIFKFSDTIEYQDKEHQMTEEEKKKMEALENENKRLKDEAKKREDEKKEEEKKKTSSPEKKSAFAESAEYAEMSSQIENMRNARKGERIKLFEKTIEEKVPKGIGAKALALAKEIADSPSFTFSDGDKTESVTPLDMLSSIIAQWTPLVKIGSSGFDYSDKNEGDDRSDNFLDWGKVTKKL